MFGSNATQRPSVTHFCGSFTTGEPWTIHGTPKSMGPTSTTQASRILTNSHLGWEILRVKVHTSPYKAQDGNNFHFYLEVHLWTMVSLEGFTHPYWVLKKHGKSTMWCLLMAMQLTMPQMWSCDCILLAGLSTTCAGSRICPVQIWKASMLLVFLKQGHLMLSRRHIFSATGPAPTALPSSWKGLAFFPSASDWCSKLISSVLHIFDAYIISLDYMFDLVVDLVMAIVFILSFLYTMQALQIMRGTALLILLIIDSINKCFQSVMLPGRHQECSWWSVIKRLDLIWSPPAYFLVFYGESEMVQTQFLPFAMLKHNRLGLVLVVS